MNDERRHVIRCDPWTPPARVHVLAGAGAMTPGEFMAKWRVAELRNARRAEGQRTRRLRPWPRHCIRAAR